MKTQNRILIGVVVLSAQMFLLGCSKKMTLTQMQTGYSLFSEELKKEIKRVEKSVIGVSATINYEIETYDYEFRDGRLIPDAGPLRYKLKRDGIIRTEDEKKLSGGGIIIDHTYDPKAYTILTSSHLVAPKDTVDTFYLRPDGLPTDALYQRKIIKNISLIVHTQGNLRVPADIITHDPIDDVALIIAQTERQIGGEFPNEPGYNLDLTWGDWTFLFGYPKEVKQMTGGWVSESPYRGTFAVDAVVRYGFSGGPVFAISEDKTRLLLVGLIKSVPSSTIDYVAPITILPAGYILNYNDLDNLMVQKLSLVDYGTAYCVGPDRIKAFLKASRPALAKNGIRLNTKYL